MICPRCRSSIPDDDLFCTFCGQPLRVQQPAAPAPPVRRGRLPMGQIALAVLVLAVFGALGFGGAWLWNPGRTRWTGPTRSAATGAGDAGAAVRASAKEPSPPPAGAGSQPAPARPLTHLKLASVSPLSAGVVSLGEAIKFGTQLALTQRKADLERVGYDIEFFPQDDQGNPQVGAQVAARLVADDQVMAIVGTLNSSVARAMLPKLQPANLVMVSPANTNPDLTRSGYTNFNRVVFNDDFQGPAAARYAAQVLKVKSVWVVKDQTAYGLGLANNFAAEARKQGLTVLGTADTRDNQTDFTAVVRAIAAANPDLIYYGGLAPAGSNLIKQARDKMADVKFMGGDGWDDPDLIKLAGKAAENTWLTSVGADLNTDAGKRFVADYKAVSSGKEPTSYGASAYDAAQVIINALIRYGDDHGGRAPRRADLAAAVRATRGYRGVAGEVSFDANGDNLSAPVFVFQITGGRQVTVGPAPVAR